MPILKIKRGLKTNLPILETGELALAIDTNEIYIGTPFGNKKIFPSSSLSINPPTNPTLGEIWIQKISDTYTIKCWDGTKWIELNISGSGSGGTGSNDLNSIAFSFFFGEE